MEKDTETSTCIAHEPCPECGSKDNLGRYSDGHGYCFGCGYFEKAGEEVESVFPTTEESVVQSDFITGEARALPKRFINEDTAHKFDYCVTRHKREALSSSELLQRPPVGRTKT